MQHRNLVIKHIAAMIETARCLLSHIRQHGVINHTLLGIIRCHFQHIQGTARIAIRRLAQTQQRRIIRLQMQRSQSTLDIMQRTAQQHGQRRRIQRLEHISTQTRQQRVIQSEGWIFGSCAHQGQGAGLDMR